MTENEAKEYLLSRYLVVGSPVNPPKEECERHNDVLDVAIYALEKVQAFEAIGTIEEFKTLKEKSVEKKPHSISIANDIGNSMVECPICHARSDYDVKSIKRGYCWKCGQKLDWSE